MRLIDADALKETIDREIFRHETIDHVFQIIDDAPTIEPKTKVIAQVTFDEEKLREIVKEAVGRFKEEYEITDRPQGEWIEMGQNEDGTHNVKCNQCDSAYKMRGHAKSISTKLKYRFCPNCGARMKGADDE